MTSDGELTPKYQARNIILGAIERELHEYKTGGDADAPTRRLISQLERELARLQQRWGFDS